MRLQDYSQIRGVNHHLVTDPEILKRDMSFMNRLNLNSTRIWLSAPVRRDPPAGVDAAQMRRMFPSWLNDREEYCRQLKYYVSECWKYGVSTMPIFWNGNGLDKATYTEEEWVTIEEYIKDIVDTLKDEPGLLMWDIINEPGCSDWIGEAPSEEVKQSRLNEIWAFVKRLCETVKKYDQETPITIGHVITDYNEITGDWVDVLSFHDYLPTRKEIGAAYEWAHQQSIKFGKPMLQTETGCICRADPYDLELEYCNKYNMGWYLFNLVITNRGWGDVHGLVYEDGTIRDPAAIAALFGFFRKRSSGRVLANPNREGHAYLAIKQVEDMLMDKKAAQHTPVVHTSEDFLNAAEYCVNLLEGAEMVAMWDAPSARIQEWRAMPEEERNIWEIKKFAFDMAMLLKEKCMIVTVPSTPTWAPDK